MQWQWIEPHVLWEGSLFRQACEPTPGPSRRTTKPSSSMSPSVPSTYLKALSHFTALPSSTHIPSDPVHIHPWTCPMKSQLLSCLESLHLDCWCLAHIVTSDFWGVDLQFPFPVMSTARVGSQPLWIHGTILPAWSSVGGLPPDLFSARVGTKCLLGNLTLF